VKCGYCGEGELLTGDIDNKCQKCKLKENNFKSNAYYLKQKFKSFAENQKDIPPEFIEIINKEFWNLI